MHSRGLDPEGQAFLFLHELEEIIREWSACVYHHTPNDGLAEPQVPGLELSPAAMFDHGVARAGYIEVPRDPGLAYEFLKTEWVPVQHSGVELRSCRYRGPALAGLAGQTSPYTGPRARGRLPVQADPDEVRGRASQAEEPAAQPHLSSRLIRIYPRRIVSWNIDPAHPGLQAHDLTGSR